MNSADGAKGKAPVDDGQSKERTDCKMRRESGIALASWTPLWIRPGQVSNGPRRWIRPKV
jgi:hypothetical protein